MVYAALGLLLGLAAHAHLVAVARQQLVLVIKDAHRRRLENADLQGHCLYIVMAYVDMSRYSYGLISYGLDLIARLLVTVTRIGVHVDMRCVYAACRWQSSRPRAVVSNTGSVYTGPLACRRRRPMGSRRRCR